MTPKDPHDYSWLPGDVLEFIAQTVTAYPEDATDASIPEQRNLYNKMCALFDPPRPKGLTINDQPIAGVPCRVYQPAKMLSGPKVIYCHGGGFVVGGLHSHDAICAELSDLTGFELIAIDYRLVPEHLHPAAYDDVKAVIEAVEGPKLLMGDSAGGNLVAAICATLPTDQHQILGQVLVYPGLGGDMDLPSYTRHAFAPMLSRAEVAYYSHLRSGGQPDTTDVTLAPLRAETYDHLPPSAIFTAECDPLASDGVEYAARLAEAGVPVTLREEPGLVHGYLRGRHSVAQARVSFDAMVAALRDLAERAET